MAVAVLVGVDIGGSHIGFEFFEYDSLTPLTLTNDTKYQINSSNYLKKQIDNDILLSITIKNTTIESNEIINIIFNIIMDQIHFHANDWEIRGIGIGCPGKIIK